ncbi:MAG TPA: hypothetical protein VGR11_05070 [Solirubrobacteraceae bacterium]|nr:hypothetical protein [Solirubrobacteraceae bacterium]
MLSLQSALLGMVSPDLRAVEVWIEDRSVRGRFAYDGELTDDHREVVSEIETLVIADLTDDAKLELEAASVPHPEPVAFVRGSVFVYLRRE